MRELAYGPRRSGRTTQLVNEIAKDLEFHDRPVYIVAETFQVAMMVKRALKEIDINSWHRVRTLSIDSLHILRGVDPRNIYFEHTAYERADSDKLKEIYSIEDRKDIWKCES